MEEAPGAAGAAGRLKSRPLMGENTGEAPLILIAAGGTGGHLFPAEALAHALLRRALAVELVTDRRVGSLVKAFPARAVHALPSATPSGKGALGKASAGLTLGFGALKALALVRRISPDASM